MLFWYAVSAVAVGLLYSKEGIVTVAFVAAMTFIAGVAGGAIGGWL